MHHCKCASACLVCSMLMILHILINVAFFSLVNVFIEYSKRAHLSAPTQVDFNTLTYVNALTHHMDVPANHEYACSWYTVWSKRCLLQTFTYMYRSRCVSSNMSSNVFWAFESQHVYLDPLHCQKPWSGKRFFSSVTITACFWLPFAGWPVANMHFGRLSTALKD